MPEKHFLARAPKVVVCARGNHILRCGENSRKRCMATTYEGVFVGIIWCNDEGNVQECLNIIDIVMGESASFNMCS